MTSEEQPQQISPVPSVEETPKAVIEDDQQQQQEQQQQPQPTEESQEASQEQSQTPTLEHDLQQQEEQQPSEPEAAPALASEGGREVSHKILYVGGLDKSITEDNLREIFSTHGAVDSVKVLFDKNKQNFNYAFVEFEDDSNAKVAFEALNGQVINNSEIRINWAYQSQQAKSNPEHFNIFVGDLSTEIDDDQLKKAFAQFPSIVQAHVMWDMQSGRSRGYGFVSFSDQKDAEQVLNTMNGTIIGNRAVRLNWASHKQQQQNGGQFNPQSGFNHRGFNRHHHHHHHHHNHMNGMGHNGLTNGFATSNLINGGAQLPTNPAAAAAAAAAVAGGPIGSNGLPMNGAGVNTSTSLNMLSPQTYDLVLRKAPSWQTTVYLGNLAHYTSQNELIPLLTNFGYIVDFKIYNEKNCAFVKFDSHERAAVAIVQLSGFIINGRPLKCGWGRDRSQNNGGNANGGNGSIQYQNYGHVMYQGR